MSEQMSDQPRPLEPLRSCNHCNGTGRDPKYGESLGLICYWCLGSGKLSYMRERMLEIVERRGWWLVK